MDQKETLRLLIREATQDLRATIEPIPQELFETRPAPHANPIGFIYFHVLRCWDQDVNIVCQGQDPAEDAWHRIGLSEELDYEPLGLGPGGEGIGFGYTDAEVDAVPKQREALMRYHQMLEDETYAYLEAATSEELNTEQRSEHSRENPFRPERWLRHMISHTNMHIGDIQYIAGLLGMPDGSYPGS